MRLLCFDLETTGVDHARDRIVQAFLGFMTIDGTWQNQREWVLNPGVEVPEGAAAVHGFTTERLAREGRTDIRAALAEIRAIIEHYCGGSGAPLVIFNASFDTTFLNAELERAGLEPLTYGRRPGEIRVVDPHVIDKYLHRFRKGSGQRKLTATAPHYGVPVETNAHDAGADCLMTGRIAIAQLTNPAIASLGIMQLQDRQAKWKREQAASLQKWFRSAAAKERRDPEMVIDGSWPILPAVSQAQIAV